MNVAYQTKAELAQFYDDIFEKQVYTRHGIVLADGACVFDVGANIGLFTVFVAHRVRGARILAFEPAPPLFAILAENTLWCAGEVLLFDCGLGDREGTAELTFYPLTSGMSSFHADAGEERAALRTLFHNQAAAGVPGIAEVLRGEEELLDQRLRAETYTRPIRTLSRRRRGRRRADRPAEDRRREERDPGARGDRRGRLAEGPPDRRRGARPRRPVAARGRSPRPRLRGDRRAGGVYRGSDRYNLYARREG